MAAVAVFALFWLAWQGADVATRFQFVVMAFLFAALVSFYAGAIGGFDGSLMREGLDAPAGSLGFWAVFAIFFPAVTGFTQGVSMSGDLKNPGRSLPIGTFTAVAVSTVVYASVAVLIAGNVPSRTLIDDPGIMSSVAAFGPLVAAGVIAATLSSAMASFLGAPRILQSLAADRVFPILNPFAQGHGPLANPRRGVLLSFGIALGTIALGDLNVIAPIVSMFFLISYGLLNYATYYEARAASPSFRPRFRFFDKRLSLAGALLCGGAMLAINATAGVGAVLVLLLVHQYLRHTDRPDRWADASRSHYFQRATEAVRAMTDEAANPRTWRPQVLAFSADSPRRARLLSFAWWLEGDSGLTGAVEIVVGDSAVDRTERRERERALRAQIDGLDLDVYGRAVLAPDATDAVPVVVQSFGLGALHANTVLFGWPEQESGLPGYLEMVRTIGRLGVNVVSMVSDERRWNELETLPRKMRRIDVWWSGDDASRLALLAAYLFTRTTPWSRAKIRLLGASPSRDSQEETEAELKAMLEEARIRAEVECTVDVTPRSIIEKSGESAFVFLPMRLHRSTVLGPFDLDLNLLLPRLPVCAAVLSGQPVDLAAGPETGSHSQLVDAEERVDTARRRARTLAKQLEAVTDEVASLREQENGATGETAEQLADAEERLAVVERRVLKAQVRLDEAERELADLAGEES